MKTLLAVLITFFFTVTAFSQDVIYTKDGEKAEVKILEIKPAEIRYKKLSNPDGPDYIVSKSQVLLITYANGTFESFGTRAGATSRFQPVDTLVTSYGKNYIAYNTFDLLLTNVTFSYERIVANGLLGIRIPLTMGFTSGDINWGGTENISRGTIMATGLDLNLYPTRQGRIRYFIAPSFLITSFNYESYSTFEYWDANYGYYVSYTTYKTKMGLQYAILIKHGLLMQITPHFNMSCVLGLGLSQNETDNRDYTNTKAILEFNVGYKF